MHSSDRKKSLSANCVSVTVRGSERTDPTLMNKIATLQPTVGNLILGFTDVRDDGNYTQLRDMNECNRIQLPRLTWRKFMLIRGPGVKSENWHLLGWTAI